MFGLVNWIKQKYHQYAVPAAHFTKNLFYDLKSGALKDRTTHWTKQQYHHYLLPTAHQSKKFFGYLTGVTPGRSFSDVFATWTGHFFLGAYRVLDLAGNFKAIFASRVKDAEYIVPRKSRAVMRASFYNNLYCLGLLVAFEIPRTVLMSLTKDTCVESSAEYAADCADFAARLYLFNKLAYTFFQNMVYNPALSKVIYEENPPVVKYETEECDAGGLTILKANTIDSVDYYVNFVTVTLLQKTFGYWVFLPLLILNDGEALMSVQVGALCPHHRCEKKKENKAFALGMGASFYGSALLTKTLGNAALRAIFTFLRLPEFRGVDGFFLNHVLFTLAYQWSLISAYGIHETLPGSGKNNIDLFAPQRFITEAGLVIGFSKLMKYLSKDTAEAPASPPGALEKMNALDDSPSLTREKFLTYPPVQAAMKLLPDEVKSFKYIFTPTDSPENIEGFNQLLEQPEVKLFFEIYAKDLDDFFRYLIEIKKMPVVQAMGTIFNFATWFSLERTKTFVEFAFGVSKEQQTIAKLALHPRVDDYLFRLAAFFKKAAAGELRIGAEVQGDGIGEAPASVSEESKSAGVQFISDHEGVQAPQKVTPPSKDDSVLNITWRRKTPAATPAETVSQQPGSQLQPGK